MTAAWVVRAGKHGEHEQANLEAGHAVISWQVGDLSYTHSRDDVRNIIDVAFPEDSPGRKANFTGQIWSFRQHISPSDYVVMPSKLRAGHLYIGECKRGYYFDASETDHRRRHKIDVEWNLEPVSKTMLKDDLMYSLNSIMTVFNPTRNNASDRVKQLYLKGRDPGNTRITASSNVDNSGPVTGSEVTDPDLTPTIESVRDRIRTHIIENFKDHKLTVLVANILEALGFRCEVSPPGPDGAVDILAGSGPLGLDSPTLIVEVKSESTKVDVKIARGLHSAMTQHRADQGLLVAWGGVTEPARREFRRDRTSFRIWDSEDVLDHLMQTYDDLPSEMRAQIPLKRTWVLDENSLS